jgi:hypothetical protein
MNELVNNTICLVYLSFILKHCRQLRRYSVGGKIVNEHGTGKDKTGNIHGQIKLS